MAELPVRFRTSLRRHYPHQVQGVSSTFLRTGLDSQPLRLPRITKKRIKEEVRSKSGIIARSNHGTHHKTASAPRDDPATKQNADGENAAPRDIEPSRTSSFRQHRSSIKRQKQQNSSCVSEWESWRDNCSYNSTSDTREHRANCSENHLARIGIDCHLTYQDVERENCSGGNNQISADYCGNAAKSEQKSVRHRTFYLIPRRWHRQSANRIPGAKPANEKLSPG
jgi:hypothetical protein